MSFYICYIIRCVYMQVNFTDNKFNIKYKKCQDLVHLVSDWLVKASC